MPTGLLPSMRRTALAAAVAALFHAVPAAANPGDPVGAPIAVAGYGVTAAVASDAAGDFVVVWAARNFPDCYCVGQNSVDIYARRFAADGTPAGSAFEVATHVFQNPRLQNQKQNPVVAMDAEGDFVVAWDEFSLPQLDMVRAQRFAADGSRSGAEMLVSLHGVEPSVAMDKDGDFVVGWLGSNVLYVPQFPPIGYGELGVIGDGTVHAQRFKANGVPTTLDMVTDFVLEGAIISAIINSPGVAMDDAGDFIVVWQRAVGNPVQQGVYARRYTASGKAMAARFQVSAPGDQVYVNGSNVPAVAMDASGGFVVAWTAALPGGDGTNNVYMHLYLPDGTAAAAETAVPQSALAQAVDPCVAMDPAGNFAVSWLNANPPATGLRLFAADGSARSGSIFFTGGAPGSTAALAMDAAGNPLLVVDSSSAAVTVKPILAQRYSGN